MSIFPKEMTNKSLSLTCESVASNFSHFYEQLHLMHLQTSSYAEHEALGALYACVGAVKDDALEKIMGYKGERIKVYPLFPLLPYSPELARNKVKEIKNFSEMLSQYANAYNMPDIKNIADELSGKAAKTLYLLTLK